LSKSNMELNVKTTSSQALLSCGNGAGLDAFYFFLFCQNVRRVGLGRSTEPKLHIRTGKPASVSVFFLDRLQSFLPQMAEANEKLKRQMEEAPAGRFDIESVDEAERVIEMDVALVELNESGDSETSDSEESDCSDDDGEVTEQNFKLPGDKGKKKKVNILLSSNAAPSSRRFITA
uniref:NOP protein chaperone 1 n=1 Tax=Maylandia zebra TaxID=106582 RepID=A0A3P9CGI7_9CICH